MINQYLEQLGFSEKEQVIYLVLAEIGVQPASIIARRSGLDRITTYKNLKRLSDRGFVKTYFRDGIQQFGIESFEDIETFLKDKLESTRELLDRFPTASNLLRSLKEGEDLIPRLQLFEGESGIRGLFRDMLNEVKEEKIRQIRMLSSNTFEEWLGDEPLAKTVREFFSDIRSRKISLELFEVTGALIPERVRRLAGKAVDLESLPAARGTTNIFIVGHTVYFACYKGSQIGLKIKQAEMSQIFHFLFDVLGRKAE